MDGYFTKFRAAIEGEDGVWVVERRVGDKRAITAKVMTDEVAPYQGAQEDCYNAMTEEKANNPRLVDLKTPEELQKECEELKRKEEEKKAKKEKLMADKKG